MKPIDKTDPMITVPCAGCAEKILVNKESNNKRPLCECCWEVKTRVEIMSKDAVDKILCLCGKDDQWIEYSKEKPPLNIHVLVWDKSFASVLIGVQVDKNDSFVRLSLGKATITHWIHQPKLPKTQESKNG